MSRLSSLSAGAIRAMLAQEADDTLAVLLTFTGGGIGGSVRITDTPKTRISVTDQDITYGITSRSNDYVFVPFKLILPDEQVAAAPRAQLIAMDVTQYLIPTLRSLTSPPTVLIELVMIATPNTVEITMPGFQLGAVNYNRDQVTCDLVVQSLANEPFPAHSFTPSYFPGLF